MCKRSGKKQKSVYVDDGHTVYDMSNVQSHTGAKSKDDSVPVTKKEKRAIILAAYARYLPAAGIIACCFLAAALLLKLWLS